MKYIEIKPLEHKIANGNLIRRCKITRTDNGFIVNQTELWFEFDASITPPADTDCDSYLLAVIMLAMRENRNIYIRGDVSKSLLSNLIEYQAAWHKWLPKTYTPIHITVESVKDDVAVVPGAICAFSGGVDATFSVWRHSQNKYSHRSQTIKLCTIVHGFDIPLDNETAFHSASQRAQKTLGDIDLPLIPIRTNYRDVIKVNWEHVFSCALVATLNNLKAVAGTCIIGSSEPYDSLVIPWGSSPITDHLLGSNAFNVIHDGASHSRTEKVAEISAWKLGSNHLRVCWQGDLKDRNCGQCEKCLRTKLNFLATGHSIPKCFPESNLLQDLETITLKNDAVRAEWKQIYEYARSKGIDAPWVQKVHKVLTKPEQSLMGRVLLTREKYIKRLSKKFKRLAHDGNVQTLPPQAKHPN